MQSEPYTMAGPTIKPEMPEIVSKRNLWPAIIVTCLILGFGFVLLLRKRPT